jgi:hypothetical protein
LYRPFQFHKRSQLFIGSHNETLSVAVRVHNPDCSSLNIKAETRPKLKPAFYGLNIRRYAK